LVEPVGFAGRHHQTVYALAEFRIVLSFGQEVGAGATVARLPRLAAVPGVEDARGRDAHPDLLLVFGMRDDGMEDEAGATRVPVLAAWVMLQALDVAPGGSVVVGGKKTGRPAPR